MASTSPCASSSVANTPQRTPPLTSAPSTTLAASDKKKAPRGRSFTIPEENVLTKAWVRILEDVIVGSNHRVGCFTSQSTNTTQQSNWAYYTCQNKDSAERRIKKILEECQSFAGCLGKSNKARLSGTLEEYVIQLTTVLFNTLEMY